MTKCKYVYLHFYTNLIIYQLIMYLLTTYLISMYILYNLFIFIICILSHTRMHYK